MPRSASRIAGLWDCHDTDPMTHTPPAGAGPGSTRGEPRSPEDPCLILIHIPRTAGQTLNGIIGRNYRPSEVFTCSGSVGDELSISGFDTRALRVVRGHVSYGIHERLDAPAVYATFLRRPLSRVVSLH